MLQISKLDVEKRLQFDNPWWDASKNALTSTQSLPRRDYFRPFYQLLNQRSVNRAILLLGPRRVGKTVMLQQSIQQLLNQGTAGQQIIFLSLETPIYTNTPLENFVHDFQQRFKHDQQTPLIIFFDEIQYLRDWEIHLKSLVDSFPQIRFVASGSAAAALRLKSRESGAGRFSEFFLPPLTFAEYLRFAGQEDALIRQDKTGEFFSPQIHQLNQELLNYLNFGGYPESVFNQLVQEQSERFVKQDIIDKVLLRDLPQLYGIRDIQELNRLFTTLAYNTGNEITLEELAKSSGVSKTTLSRYLEYLEAAFLIRRVRRIDQNARHFQRSTSFKVYLTNPSMHAALFGTPAEDDQSMGALAETALFSQWFHQTEVVDNLYYARWKGGEVDLVYLNPKTQQPSWASEIKWSDRPAKDSKLRRHLLAFQSKHPQLSHCEITTKTIGSEEIFVTQDSLKLVPTSLAVYRVGRKAREEHS